MIVVTAITPKNRKTLVGISPFAGPTADCGRARVLSEQGRCRWLRVGRANSRPAPECPTCPDLGQLICVRGRTKEEDDSIRTKKWRTELQSAISIRKLKIFKASVLRSWPDQLRRRRVARRRGLRPV